MALQGTSQASSPVGGRKTLPCPIPKLSSNLESSIIQQQRQEIHLLTAELKDRDKELTDMVAVHQKQLLAWERDRQKALALAEQCNLLKNELKKRNEMIKSLTQQKLKEMSQKVADATFHSQTLEEKNHHLHCSVLDLSAKTGQLQAREQELLSTLKLKDEVILEKTDRITELESALCAAKAEKFNLIRKIDDLTLRLEELMVERNKLKDGLCEMVKENNKKEEEIIQLRQENGCLRNELVLTVEKAKRVEQFLQFAKSKQARTNIELECLRQMYLKQQCDLEFLHVTLESSQELSMDLSCSVPESNSETDSVSSEGSHEMHDECRTEQIPKGRVKTTSEMCEADNRLLLNASNTEDTTSEHLNQEVVEVLSALTEEEKQDVASNSDELDSEAFCEANNTRPLRNREMSQNEVERKEQQTFEASLPECEHCLSISSCVESQSILTQNVFDKTDSENKTCQERIEVLFYEKSEEAPAAIHKPESDSCGDNFNMKRNARWKPVSDLECLEIFKPINGNGRDCSCLRTEQEMKCASSESEEIVNLDYFHLESICLTSTQKRDKSQTCEKSSDEDFPLEINYPSVTEPTNGCCRTTMDQRPSSPTSKLYHLLAECQQVAADLELSLLLQASHCCSTNSSNANRAPELAEASHRTQLPAAEERSMMFCEHEDNRIKDMNIVE